MAQALAASFSFGRWVLAGLLAMASLAAGAAEPTARVLTFSPQGAVPSAQQVRATFSEPMQPLGKVAAPGPFDVDCALQGDAHWADDRTWVMDLKEQVLDGQACEFRVKPGLRSLAGRTVGEPLAFRFQLPVLTDEMRRNITQVYPRAGAEWIAEDQAFLLVYSHPLGSARPDVRCEAPGHGEVPALHLPAEVRDELKKTMSWIADDRSEAVRCPFALAPESPLTLRLLRPGGLKPSVMNFKVRPLPAATVACRHMPQKDGCAASFPIALRFNAALPEAVLREIRLEGVPHARPNRVVVDPGSMFYGGSSTVTFDAAFQPDTAYRIRWPDTGLADTSGRALQRDRLPTRITTLPLLGLAYFAAQPFSIRPLLAQNSVEVALQGAADPVVRAQVFGTGRDEALADQQLLRRMGLLGDGKETVGHFWPTGGWQFTRSFNPQLPVLPADARPLPLADLQPVGTAPLRRGQVALQGAGLHVLELQAFAGEGQVAPVHDSVAVLLTRLAVHLKVATENSVVWVTRLADGAPVARVALRAYDCRGQLAWQGVSDARGLAVIDRKAIGRCGYPDAGVTVFARHTWPDGERDLSVANSRWPHLLETGSYGLRGAFGDSTMRVHTVFDRSLFKPGETVSMRHVVREEGLAGLLPPRQAMPAQAKVLHPASGKEWTFPVTWAAPGEGSSRFELPADAPLGRYTVLLDVADRSSSFSYGSQAADFAVEAFRLPTMAGSIQAPQPRLIYGTAPALQLALHYADGGAAQHWPVTLRVYAQARGHRRPAALDSFHNATFAGTAEQPAQVLVASQSLTLDAQGRAQATLPELPTRAQPYLLHAELSYQDPNGEAQTLSQDFDVQRSLLAVGIRTLGQAAVGRRMELQSLVVDETGAPRAAQPVRVNAWRKDGYGPGKAEDLGEACRGLTDALGRLVCPFVPGQPGLYQFQVTAADPQGRVATSFTSQGLVQERFLPAQPLFLHADKALYREGDTASIAVSNPLGRARAWLTLERRGVLESRMMMLEAGQNRIRLPIRREWAGNVAVSLLVLDAGATPAMATGITELVVSTDAHALRISLKPERRRYQPGDLAQVRIHVAAPRGQRLPAVRRLSFVAVDEALLNLKDNTSWQLLARMLRPRDHGVASFSSQAMNPPVDAAGMRLTAEGALLDRFRRAAEAASGQRPPVAAAAKATADDMGRFPDGGMLESVMVTGMRATQGAEPPPPARTLLDSLLHWQADVPVDSLGNATVSFPVKDALSRFRLVAVASAGDEHFGTGMAHLDVMKDLQITAGLPPQVREGDRFAALVTVRNTSATTLTLDASAQLAGQTDLPPRTLQLRAGESRQLSWEVSVPAGAKALDWTFTARERGGAGRQDALATRQQVEPAVPVTVQAATLAQVNGSYSLPAFGFDNPDARNARVNVQLLPSLAGKLGGVQAWLASYAYRCLEQSASRAVGLHDRNAWNAVMAELPRYLDDDGLANYFPRSAGSPWQGSDTLTSYLLDLSAAAGWPIPDEERSLMLKALERFVAGDLKRSFWAPQNDGLARRLAAMATLARHGQLKPAPFEALRVDVDEWTTAMLTDWLAIVRKTGLRPDTQAQTENALRARLSYQGRRMVFSTEKRDYWWWLMSNGDVDAARLLLTVADLPGWQADLPRLLNGLLGRQQANGAWATTNANAWGTLAVDAFARLMEPVPVAGATRVTLGQHQQTVDWLAPGPKTLDVALNPATDALRIQHDGAGAPWASVAVRAAVPLTAPRFAGYSVSRSLTPVQQKVAGEWHVGDVVRVRLAIRAQADMSWVVVDDPVPAGASILGAGLGRDSAAATAGEQAEGHAWPLYQARDFTSFKSFYRHVPRGEFSLEYTVRLNNPGQFALPSTRVEAMYAPEVFGEAPNAVFAIAP